MAIIEGLRVDSPVRRIRDLPGPRGLPLLGNALQIQRERLHRTAEQWAREYGEVFRFRIGAREFVVVSNPEMVATMLRDRPDGFQRTDRLNAAARELGFSGLFSANGEDWKRQRPMVLRGLDPTHIKAFHPDAGEGHAALRGPLARGPWRPANRSTCRPT